MIRLESIKFEVVYVIANENIYISAMFVCQGQLQYEKCKFPLFKSREYIRIYVRSVYNHILPGVTSILMHHYTLDAIIN